MKALSRTINPQSKLWTFVFALVAGSFITGMTGYATHGTAYPIVLVIAIAINYLLASFFKNISSLNNHGFYYRLMHLFDGKTRQFFSSFIGMCILMVLPLLLTLMSGPFGLLVYILIRISYTRSLGIPLQDGSEES